LLVGGGHVSKRFPGCCKGRSGRKLGTGSCEHSDVEYCRAFEGYPTCLRREVVKSTAGKCGLRVAVSFFQIMYNTTIYFNKGASQERPGVTDDQSPPVHLSHVYTTPRSITSTGMPPAHSAPVKSGTPLQAPYYPPRPFRPYCLRLQAPRRRNHDRIVRLS
jgi:hypothetical protein